MDQPRVIHQSRFGYHRTYSFGRNSLSYTDKDPSGVASYEIPYENLVTDSHSELSVKNAGFSQRIILALLSVMVILKIVLQERADWLDSIFAVIVVSMVLTLILAYSGFFGVKFHVLQASPHRILVLKDEQAHSILLEMQTRRLRRLDELYGQVHDCEPDEARRRLEWLCEQGAISRTEMAARLNSNGIVPTGSFGRRISH